MNQVHTHTWRRRRLALISAEHHVYCIIYSKKVSFHFTKNMTSIKALALANVVKKDTRSFSSQTQNAEFRVCFWFLRTLYIYLIPKKIVLKSRNILSCIYNLQILLLRTRIGPLEIKEYSVQIMLTVSSIMQKS